MTSPTGSARTIPCSTEVGRLGDGPERDARARASRPRSRNARPARGTHPALLRRRKPRSCATRWPRCAPTPSSTSRASLPESPPGGRGDAPDRAGISADEQRWSTTCSGWPGLDQHPGQQARPGRPHRPRHRLRRPRPRPPTRRTGPLAGTRRRAGLEAVGDEELLRRAIDNLLANVRAHTPAGDRRPPSAQAEATAAPSPLRSATTAPASPSIELPAHLRPLLPRRAAVRTALGPASGLAIVAAIAVTHNGTAEAALGDPHGLCITLILPVSSPAQPS